MIDDRPYCNQCEQPITLVSGGVIRCRCSRFKAIEVLEDENYPDHWPYDVMEYLKDKREAGEV